MQFIFRLLFAALFFGAMVACSGEVKRKCSNVNDCLGGEVCCKEAGETDGECKAEKECTGCKTPCRDKSDCLNQQICKDGCCANDCQVPCQSQSDCTNNQTCQNGCCVGSASCQKHTDCAVGQECIGGINNRVCQACIQPCSSITDCSGRGITCEHGCCRRPACSSDSNCSDLPQTPHCNTKSGECVACATNDHCQKINDQTLCRNEKCEKVECVIDRHCPISKPLCDKERNKCVEKAICLVDRDCSDPSGQLVRCDPNANSGRGACKKGHCVTCATDDECGGAGDFCLGTDKGLKDGRRCLRACVETSDCPPDFVCSDAIINGFKICFPPKGFCEDPCKNKKCPDKHVCDEGVCKRIPEPCLPCQGENDTSTCGSGNVCLQYIDKYFCGKSCSSQSNCPSPTEAPGRQFHCVGGQCVDVNECAKGG